MAGPLIVRCDCARDRLYTFNFSDMIGDSLRSSESVAGSNEIVSDPLKRPRQQAELDEAYQEILANCRVRGFLAEVVADGDSARARLAELIPPGADLTTGGSQTLYQIHFMDDVNARINGWRSRRHAILAEPDEHQREILRRAATSADYMIGSVNALTLSGQAVCADHGGTRVGAYCYGAEKVIWVVGKNKLVPTLDEALRRVREHVFPLESARVRREWNSDSAMFKTLIVEGEHRAERIRIILVDQDLGF